MEALMKSVDSILWSNHARTQVEARKALADFTGEKMDEAAMRCLDRITEAMLAADRPEDRILAVANAIGDARNEIEDRAKARKVVL